MDDEVEALTAIYADDFTDHGARGDVRRVSVRVAPSIAGSGERAWVSCSVAADLPPGYPDEPASLAVEDVVGLSPAQASELSGVMLAAAVEHAGEPCLYAVAERVREWLSERNERPSDGSAFDDMVRRQRMKDAAPAGPTQAFSREDDPSVQHRVVVSAAEADEATRRKRDGTPVTTASFFAWREAFEAEMAREAERLAAAASSASGARKAAEAPRLTGRQLFESGTATGAGAEAEAQRDEADDVDFRELARAAAESRAAGEYADDEDDDDSDFDDEGEEE